MGFGLLAALLAATGTQAGEVTLSLGYNDILDRLDDPAFAAGLGYTWDPVGGFGPFRLAIGAGVEGGASGSLWAGAGPVLFVPLQGGWRIGLSVMPGAYREGQGIDLGSQLEFRSRLGVSRALTPDWSVGLAIEHKSNADIARTNPGVETLFLTVSQHF